KGWEGCVCACAHCLLRFLGVLIVFLCAQETDWQSAKSIYDFHALDIDGNDVSLEKYRSIDVCLLRCEIQCPKKMYTHFKSLMALFMFCFSGLNPLEFNNGSQTKLAKLSAPNRLRKYHSI
uniref:Uncharacterized protein n=1 Tax=Anolis carolinensis TaxID=28377 RepID=A0A803TTU2_ANOCA